MVFLDGDGSDCPGLMNQLVDPIISGTHDFVIGSRTRGKRERGSMNFQQIFSGRIAGWLISILYGVRYTDMCPFRAIRRDALERLSMREMTYGWNIEMQMKAARAGLRILEIPVNHRNRAGGQSKVSGTFRGTLVAGARILATLVRIALKRHLGQRRSGHDFVLASFRACQKKAIIGRIARWPRCRNRHDVAMLLLAWFGIATPLSSLAIGFRFSFRRAHFCRSWEEWAVTIISSNSE